MAAASAVLTPHLAFAQSTAAATSATAAPAGQNAAEPSDAIAEVMVTARRKSERENDVPLTINVESREALAESNIVSIKELTQVTPGLNFTFIGGAAQPTVRGISSESTGAGAENNIAIYVDGVYQPAIYGNSFDLPDVDHVEVLKGPQGTLFGRNATGGAILVYTRNPEFTPSGSFEVSDGIFNGGANDMRYKGFYTAPLSDNVAFSVSAQYAKNDGYFNDVLRDQRAGGIDDRNVRAKLLIKPADGVTLLLSGYYDDRADYSVFATQNIDSPFPNVPTKPFNVADDTIGFNKVKSYGTSLKADFEFAAGTLTSLSAWSVVLSLIHI